VPPQTLALALAASIYPPAVAAVIALGRGSHVRSRVFAFVLAAVAITYAAGALMLFVLVELGATGSIHWTPSSAFDLALGLALIGLAFHLRTRQAPATTSKTASKLGRYLQSRRLAFMLGLTLYVLPSPIYVGAVKTIADAEYSTSRELLALAVTVAVMLWLIEIPMLVLLAAPERASSSLERVNLWFAARGRLLAVILSASVGLYLSIRGLVGLVS
jgi:Sap, sulfolipid-1-addressing protein